ncbi:mechanosensitive ion channel domain-containing protein [Holophaga foetida]|uniref:mechanosensitive ion channel domain-containing protein n=1 Tax=Holophaga foetida TaxID=35839 RepID=UPI0002474D26|nr:mechanosensitive ion channel domain-containing protein [Holophaga foetida]
MKRSNWIISGILLLLLLAIIGGLAWTRDSGPPAGLVAKLQGKKAKKDGKPVRKERTVDTAPLLMARQLGSLAATGEEQELARQAERLTNHELTLAFTSAMRRTAETSTEPSPEVKELAAIKAKAEDAVEADQQAIKDLNRRLARAQEREKDALEDQLEVAKAQMELDQDELDSAREDLDQAGGDSQARIKRLKEAYDAMEREPSVIGQAAAPLTTKGQNGSLLTRLRNWKFQRNKLRQLAQARQDTQARVQRLNTRREKLAQRVKDEAAKRAEAKQEASGFAKGGTQYEGTTSKEEKKAAIDTLKLFMARQQQLSITTKRIQDMQALDEAYDSWEQLAVTYRRAALHTLLKGLLTIVCVLIVIFLLDRVIERVFHGMAKEKLRAATLQAVVKFAVLMVGLIVILFTIIGLPGNVTTILGLAGAGLTVALKDFIVAFFGWFVLMGKNGLRVGDWVEIKGVGGEVVEVGLLRTVLMETGSWNDLGHPTGRKVAFVNNFAVEGHFFNFSTSGQWMWDELQLVIPPGTDPYPIIDGVQKLVEEKTEANAKLAQEEWHKATTRYRVRTFSAVPGINVVSTVLGIEIHVRYITRAYERNSTRKALNSAVLELMHGKPASPAAPIEMQPEPGV